MESYTRHYGIDQAIWALQAPWNNTPDTMYATRHHGHHRCCRHLETIENTLWTHCILLENIHRTQYTPQTTMDTMRSAETRQLYNRQIGYHKDPWTIETPGNHITGNMHYTRHNGHHGQWIEEGTIQETLWTPPDTVDTMASVSVSARVRVRVMVSVSFSNSQSQ